MSHPAASAIDVHPVRHEVESLVERLKAHEGPILTLYLDVHAGSDPNAPAQRADAALRALPLDRDARERCERSLSEALRGASEGTLAFFYDPEGHGLSAHRLLRIAPPLPGGADPAAARWGDPWTEPLELLLASEPPVVAVFADARRARVFVHDLGEVIEASAYVRALDPSGWRRYQESQTGMPGTPARGGSGHDDFEDRVEAWTARFIASVTEQVQATIAAREGARLMLLGEARRRKQLEDAAPAPLRAALLASDAAPVDADLGAHRWSGPLAEKIRAATHAEDESLLTELERNGVTGVGPTLDALQRGALSLVAVPADVDVDVVHCLGTDWIAEDEESARRVCAHGPIEHAPLKRFLRTAARRGRARLRILRGPDATDLEGRVGPLAGLPRRG